MPNKKQRFKTFRGYLSAAIGDRTQAQFAHESGISPEHINRMLNADTIARPNKNTLVKIANHARHAVTYAMLEEVLNAEDENYEKPIIESVESMAQNAKLREAQRESAPTFEEQAKETYMHLSQMLLTHKPCKKDQDVLDYLDDILRNLKTIYPDDLEISYMAEYSDKYYGKKYKSQNYMILMLTVANWQYSAISELVIYFDNDMIHKFSMAMPDIIDVNGLPPGVLKKDRYTYEEAMKLPCYYVIIENEHPTVKHNYEGSQEEQLLRSIFGNTVEYPETILGIGFELKEIPKELKNLVELHLYQLLEHYDDSPDEYKDLISNVQEKINDNKSLAGYFDEFGYLDANSLESGWGAVISTIMQKETAMPFEFYNPTDLNKTDNYKDYNGPISKYPVILLRQTDITAKDIDINTVYNAVYKFAYGLGVKSFGHLQFCHIKRDNFVHTDEWEIDYNKPAPIWEPEINPYDDNITRKPEEFIKITESRPTEVGLYKVRLKDKRILSLLYIPQKDHWVGRHHEWSDWVEAYHPARMELKPELKPQS